MIKIKKLLSVVLAIMIVLSTFSMLNLSAFADTTEGPKSVQTYAVSEYESVDGFYADGAVIAGGKHNTSSATALALNTADPRKEGTQVLTTALKNGQGLIAMTFPNKSNSGETVYPITSISGEAALGGSPFAARTGTTFYTDYTVTETVSEEDGSVTKVEKYNGADLVVSSSEKTKEDSSVVYNPSIASYNKTLTVTTVTPVEGDATVTYTSTNYGNYAGTTTVIEELESATDIDGWVEYNYYHKSGKAYVDLTIGEFEPITVELNATTVGDFYGIGYLSNSDKSWSTGQPYMAFSDITVNYDTSSYYAKEAFAFNDLWNEKFDECEKNETALNQLLSDYETALTSVSEDVISWVTADEFRLKVANAIEKYGDAKAIAEFKTNGDTTDGKFSYEFTDRVNNIHKDYASFSYGTEGGKSYIELNSGNTTSAGVTFPNVSNPDAFNYKLTGEIKLAEAHYKRGQALIYGSNLEGTNYLGTVYSMIVDSAGGFSIGLGEGTVSVNADGTPTTNSYRVGGSHPGNLMYYTSKKSNKRVVKTDVYTPCADATYDSAVTYYSFDGTAFSAVTTDETDFATNYASYYTLASNTATTFEPQEMNDSGTATAEQDGVYTVTTITNEYGFFAGGKAANDISTILTTDNLEAVQGITAITDAEKWVGFTLEYRGVLLDEIYNTLDFNVDGVQFSVERTASRYEGNSN